MQFPTLYKKTATGAIQQWRIWVDGNTIHTEFGQYGGALQTTSDVVKEGKNAGRANATTPEQQAQLEAKSKWEKKSKSGYVTSSGDAEAGKVDEEFVEGGVVPMLAHKFSEHGHKVNYPAHTQPKLDGIRCIAHVKDGKCTLWSRTRKPITGVPHIAKTLAAKFPKGEYMFDGELYNHGYKANFEKIVSLVRQETPVEGHEVVEYHVYDMVIEDTFARRSQQVLNLLSGVAHVCVVQTDVIGHEDELMARFEEYLSQGYEGAMVRNSSSKYVNKRSYDLLKVKEFDDAEFEIVGVNEGRGKLAGHAATFTCKTADGQEFQAKLKGELADLKAYLNNHYMWQGKKLTVQYQGLTGKNGVPRFPVGVRIRAEE